MKLAIQAVIQDLMDRVMTRVLKEDPFLPESHKARKPLYTALVPDEIFKGSHFERRFVTRFGHVWEQLAIVAAEKGLGHGVKGYEISGTIKEGRLRRISEILNQLEHSVNGKKKRKPNWDFELAYILQGVGQEIPIKVVCDIYAQNNLTGERFAFELKGPLPNSDQTKVSKEKILKLYAMTDPQIEGAYYALPYNPYGTKREDYEWSFPGRWFDMKRDEAVLIGNEFWEKVGGVGTYQAFIDAVNEIAPEYKERIYREFLCIEPPDGFDARLEYETLFLIVTP